MLAFAATRLLQLIPTILLISVLVFSLAHLAPGDPIQVLAGPQTPQEEIDRLREQYGLDQPLVVQFTRWFSRAIRGDLGNSIRTGQPVATMIAERIGPTLTLALLATLFSVAIALPAGILSAMRRGTSVDTTAMTFTSLAISLPNFFTAIVLIVVFGVWLRLLPLSGYVPLSEDFAAGLKRMIMPTISLGLIYTALLSRLIRSDLLDILREDYIRTARGKGLSERTIALRHGLRNALIPAVNLVSLNFASLLGGTIIIEEIFALPGLGRLVISAVHVRDFPVIQGVTLAIGLVFVLANIVADFLASVIDPRVRL